MTKVHQAPERTAGPALGTAVNAFLAELTNANTSRAYATPLHALVIQVGAYVGSEEQRYRIRR